jgi:hypothetical protein
VKARPEWQPSRRRDCQGGVMAHIELPKGLPGIAGPLACVGSLTARTMTSADEAPAIDTVVLAFAADPVARWSWPHSHQYLASMPSFIRAFGGNAFTHGSAYCTDGYAGAALWLPPGVPPDEEILDEIVCRTVSASTRAIVIRCRHIWNPPILEMSPCTGARVRGCRHDSGWLIATAHPDAAATPLRA